MEKAGYLEIVKRGKNKREGRYHVKYLTTENRAQINKTSNKTIVVNPHSSLVVFSINRLSFLSKRQDTIICCPQETYFSYMDIHILQIKG